MHIEELSRDQKHALLWHADVEGNGSGIVVDIGDNTVMGKISQMTGKAKGKKTTLQVEINRFVNIILSLILATGVAGLLAWGCWVRVDYPSYLTIPALVANMGSFVVGYTPEGLPVALTMTLAIVARRLAKYNVLIKDLAIIETFNTISLIASDKTGVRKPKQSHTQKQRSCHRRKQASPFATRVRSHSFFVCVFVVCRR